MIWLLALVIALLPVTTFGAVWLTVRNAESARKDAADSTRLQNESHERVMQLLTSATTSTTAANAAAATAISGTIADGLRPPAVQPAPIIQFAPSDSGTWWGQDQQAMSGPIDPLDAYSDAPIAPSVNRVGGIPAGYDPIAAMQSGGGWASVAGGMSPPDLSGEYEVDNG